MFDENEGVRPGLTEPPRPGYRSGRMAERGAGRFAMARGSSLLVADRFPLVPRVTVKDLDAGEVLGWRGGLREPDLHCQVVHRPGEQVPRGGSKAPIGFGFAFSLLGESQSGGVASGFLGKFL